MRQDENDPNIVWMTEDELRKATGPSKLGLWMILLSGPAGVLVAQLVWWLALR